MNVARLSLILPTSISTEKSPALPEPVVPVRGINLWIGAIGDASSMAVTSGGQGAKQGGKRYCGLRPVCTLTIDTANTRQRAQYPFIEERLHIT